MATHTDNAIEYDVLDAVFGDPDKAKVWSMYIRPRGPLSVGSKVIVLVLFWAWSVLMPIAVFAVWLAQTIAA